MGLRTDLTDKKTALRMAKRNGNFICFSLWHKFHQTFSPLPTDCFPFPSLVCYYLCSFLLLTNLCFKISPDFKVSDYSHHKAYDLKQVIQYKITHAGEQVAQWDFPSMCFFAPCDRIVQRAYLIVIQFILDLSSTRSEKSFRYIQKRRLWGRELIQL